MDDICALCKRKGAKLTKHHLIPREEGGTTEDIVFLCEACHKQIHALYTNKELALRLKTIEELKEDYKIKKYINFIKKQPVSKKLKVAKSQEVRKK